VDAVVVLADVEEVVAEVEVVVVVGFQENLIKFNVSVVLY